MYGSFLVTVNIKLERYFLPRLFISNDVIWASLCLKLPTTDMFLQQPIEVMETEAFNST